MEFEKSKDLIVQCPHCGLFIEIEQINCRIFRHGIFKSTGEQIPPHATKDFCDKILAQNDVYGCAKPFELVQDSSGVWIARPCEYI